MKKFYLFIFIVASAACIITAQSRCEDVNVKALTEGKTASVEAQPKGKTLSATAQQLAKAGYVNIQDADPSIHVSLMYARADNFTGRVLYARGLSPPQGCHGSRQGTAPTEAAAPWPQPEGL